MAVLPVGTRRRLMKHPLGWVAAGFMQFSGVM